MNKLLSILVVLVLLLSACSGTKPTDIGLSANSLTECPSSPNCVSTQTKSAKHKMDPISFTGSVVDANAKIVKILNAKERVTITENSGGYIHSEFKSKLMKYVDDVEFYFDEVNKLIHFRSASRKGYSDLGVNKKRMEEIIEAFGK